MREVARCLIEEVSLEDGIVEHKVIALGLILNRAEVRVALHSHGIFMLESKECLVALHLVLRRQLHGTVRHNVAIILNCENMIVKTVNLSQIIAHDVGLGILLFS